MTTAHDEHGPAGGQPGPGVDEAGIEELLRQVGARDEPAQEMMKEVHAAVHAEWQAMLAERRRRRRSVVAGIAASVAFAIVLATYGLRFMTPESVSIATITRVEGQLLAGSDDAWSARPTGEAIVVGESLRTDARSRASMRFADNISLRLDHDTTVIMEAPDRVMLRTGALYVDSPPAGASSALTVQARGASIRHLGTQYEVRTAPAALEVSVREGRVVISNTAGTVAGQAGEKIRLTRRGEVARTALARNDPHWQWVTSVAPVFDIENQPLSSFLNWTARETGRRLVYASANAEAAAAQVKMRGSIAGLDPDTALSAVLATTQLRRYDGGDGIIGITLAADAAHD